MAGDLGQLEKFGEQIFRAGELNMEMARLQRHAGRKFGRKQFADQGVTNRNRFAVVDDGRMIQANIAPGSFLSVDGKRYHEGTLADCERWAAMVR